MVARAERGGQDSVGSGRLVLAPCFASTDALASALLKPRLLKELDSFVG